MSRAPCAVQNLRCHVRLALSKPSAKRERSMAPKKDAKGGKSDPKAQAKAAKASSGGGKQKKKKWSKGKNKEKVNNAILYDKTSHEKMMAEVPKFKMITISILSDRLRINCSLARRTLAYLVEKGLVREVVRHAKQVIYTRATNT